MKYSVQNLRTMLPLANVVHCKPNNSQKVLVSGATGWLGRHIVEELLDRGWRVVAPVRAANTAEAHKRLLKWAGNPNVEIIPVNDISDVHLYPQVGAIVHSAADMSLAKGVEQLWSSNVQSTQALYEWARKTGCTRFDFVSTLSVFVSSDCPGRIFEEQELDSAQHLYGGYAASKWLSEVWLQSQHFGMNVAVHRLGLLSYSQRYGWAPDDGIAAWGQAWQQWGVPQWMAPNEHHQVDWTPVVYAAKGIVNALETQSCGVHHWCNSLPTPSTVWTDLFAQRFGTTNGHWPNSVLGKRATRALGRWSNPQRHHRFWWHDVFQSSGHTYDQRRANMVQNSVQWTRDELWDAVERL